MEMNGSFTLRSPFFYNKNRRRPQNTLGGPSAGLDVLHNYIPLSGIEPMYLGCAARILLLYSLSYPVCISPSVASRINMP